MLRGEKMQITLHISDEITKVEDTKGYELPSIN